VFSLWGWAVLRSYNKGFYLKREWENMEEEIDGVM